MRILYAIQGTGNGHVARAEDIIPELRRHGELDVFISGAQTDIDVGYPVRYKSAGLSFYFGKSGGIDLFKTFRKNNAKRVYREICDFPVGKYDIVINDFEPISAWAALRKGIPCIGLSHQSALLSPKSPAPSHYDPVGAWILSNYAPARAHVGFHFASFDDNIFTPVIRSSVRNARVERGDHYTVYLPAYDDRKLVGLLGKIPAVKWEVFSKHTRKHYRIDNVVVQPVSNVGFQISMARSRGVLCGAGFETPAESLYLGKKLLVIPMKRQYEQFYNAAALMQLGVPVIRKLSKKHLEKVREWIDTDGAPLVNFPEVTRDAVTSALSKANDNFFNKLTTAQISGAELPA